jgi:CBS domain-containing protein
MSLFCQAGVAVGLSIVASQRFRGDIGDAIIMVIAMTTLVLEIVGPPFVKLAVKRAGEVGLNVTKEDLMQSYTVGEVVNRESPYFAEGATFAEILRTIGETDAMHYPVADGAGRLAGVITIQELKDGMAAQAIAEWLVAYDLMQPVPDTVTEGAPLAEAVARMREQGLEYLPVVAEQDGGRLVGMLELRAVDRMLSQEVLRRQRLADGHLG